MLIWLRCLFVCKFRSLCIVLCLLLMCVFCSCCLWIFCDECGIDFFCFFVWICVVC